MTFGDYVDDKIPSVENLLEYAEHKVHGFSVRVVSKKHKLDRPITLNETNRPSLNLFGFFDYFSYNRVQIFGRGECSLLEHLFQENNLESIKKFFEYDLPCIFFSHDYEPTEAFIKMADEKNIPVLVSSLSTNELTDRIYDFFAEYLYISEVLHGLMMEVCGIGVLIKGGPEIPLSELGLELIQRGHYLVADDVVNVKSQKGKNLLAFTSDMIAHHMEVAGIGIINVAHLFGVNSIRHQRKIDLVIKLEYFDENKSYDLVGNQDLYQKVIDIELPKVLIPIRKGISVAVLVETASMNQRLKITGYNPAKEFNKRIVKYSNKSSKA